MAHAQFARVLCCRRVRRYEDLVRSPEVEMQRICNELLAIAWEPGMANPYNTSATESFQAARGFATTDPKLFRRKSIDPRQADKWRDVKLPQALQRSTEILAHETFGYELMPELPEELVWLSRSPASAPTIVFLHDFTGRLWGLDALVSALKAPVIGIHCSQRLIDGCSSMQELAMRYVRLLPRMARRPVQLLAYSLGCRIAYRMACTLEQMGERVQLTLLDGPVGPERIGPPRMGGLAADVAQVIRESLLSASPSIPERVGETIRPLTRMLASAGEEAVHIATSIIELPDPHDAPEPPLLAPTLYVSAEKSMTRENGTFGTAQSCLPQLKHVTVAGGHFDFLQTSAQEVGDYVRTFFSSEVSNGMPS